MNELNRTYFGNTDWEKFMMMGLTKASLSKKCKKVKVKYLY